MRELEAEYGDQVYFNVVPAEVTAESADELEEYGLTERRHGLVAFDAAGEAVASIPGHEFGREEIEEAILAALGSG